jgi:hypothetical protein
LSPAGGSCGDMLGHPFERVAASLSRCRRSVKRSSPSIVPAGTARAGCASGPGRASPRRGPSSVRSNDPTGSGCFVSSSASCSCASLAGQEGSRNAAGFG